MTLGMGCGNLVRVGFMHSTVPLPGLVTWIWRPFHVPSLATVKVSPSALSKSPPSSSYICNRLAVFSSASSARANSEKRTP
jgi:hypothetical protein